MSKIHLNQSINCLLMEEKLNAAYYFIMKVQQIASNHLSGTDFKDFMKLYKDYTEEPYSFLLNDATLSSDNP